MTGCFQVTLGTEQNAERKVDMTLSSSKMRVEWSEYECNSLEYATMTVLNRKPVKTILKLVRFWEAFDATMRNRGYGDAGIVGSYACRNIAGKTTKSLHSYRLAIDVDPSLNGRYSGAPFLKGKITKAQVAAVEAIRTNSGAQVFYWGGWFKDRSGNPIPDPMHFQLCCTQADIASGLDISTVDIDPGTMPDGGNYEMHTIEYGAGFKDSPEKMTTVKALQIMLADNGFADGNTNDSVCAADGLFGKGTEAAVKAFQSANGLIADGVVGPATWSALEGW